MVGGVKVKKFDEFAQKHIMELLERDDATPSMYINDISKIFNTRISHASKLREMSHGSRRILFHLTHDDGLTQLQLVKLTHLTAPSVSAALVKLENDGLVKRITDKEDLRQIRVYLTEKGREYNSFVRKKCCETEEIMMKDISASEQEQLCIMLKKILKNLVEKP